VIDKKTRIEIKGYLQGFVHALIEEHRPQNRAARIEEKRTTYTSKEGDLKPFHDVDFPVPAGIIIFFDQNHSVFLPGSRGL
jgi:hypothetical protein